MYAVTKHTCSFLSIPLCFAANTITHQHTQWQQQCRLERAIICHFGEPIHTFLQEDLFWHTAEANKLCKWVVFLAQKHLAASLADTDTTLIKTKLRLDSKLRVFFFLFLELTSHSFHLADTFFSKPFHLNTVNVTLLWRRLSSTLIVYCCFVTAR